MIRYLSHSEAGGHAVNEDAREVRAHPRDPGLLLCAVADGQGGQAGGAAAAQLACRTCIATAERMAPDRLLDPGTWAAVLRAADEAVQTDPEAGYTTLVGLAVTTTNVCGASNGDSAAIAVGAGTPPDLLTAGQRKNPPVGSGMAPFVPFGFSLAAPWKVLVVTDGVWKYAGMERILQLVSSLSEEALLRALRERCRLRNGSLQDDWTAVLCWRDAT